MSRFIDELLAVGSLPIVVAVAGLIGLQFVAPESTRVSVVASLDDTPLAPMREVEANLTLAAADPSLPPPIVLADGDRMRKGGSAVTREMILADYVEQRMLARVPDAIEPYFDIMLYVSRAEEGAYAQRLYVFERQGLGFGLYAVWPVSTGRELMEKYWTGTPDGLFKLDHRRFYETRVSRQWGSEMPWAMFWDAEFEHKLTGYAIHGAGTEEDVANLGERASAGCIRLHPEHARELFLKIQAEAWGRVPAFVYDEETDSTSLKGEAVTRSDGRLVLRRGYKVLLVVENFDGGPDTPIMSDDAIASLF